MFFVSEASCCRWSYGFGAIFQLIARPAAQRLVEFALFNWIPAGPMHTTSGHLVNFNAQWGYLFDPLTAVMVGIVTGVGFLIHVYSMGYMAHEGGYYRFFGYLNLFMFSMLTLVLANNILMMFVGWEGVGLCSYLLIGFYFLKKSASDAGKKAFIVNRIGDTGFLLGIFLLVGTLGTLNFTAIRGAILAGHFAVGDAALTAIALLLFVGATGKSAQIPLYVWLPDAMEGPTPVSALIHAATMVTAGVYMLVRTNAIFAMAPRALTVIAVVGAVTALFAATMGVLQNDIKKVLAYSTISQLGYMFLACGVGAFGAGIFHLMTHAFFKGLALPRRGQRDPRDERRAGHAEDGRARRKNSHDVSHDVRGDAGDRGDSAVCGIFQQGRNSGARVSEEPRAVVRRLDYGGDDGVLHVPPAVPDILGEIARAA